MVLPREAVQGMGRGGDDAGVTQREGSREPKQLPDRKNG